ncbi:MAG TPA: peptidylprolyl isomerase, partial [Chthoniobacterales bacterium]|nr:peptidylprolyl isomerase [Chthoniobacterales bacterium]
MSNLPEADLGLNKSSPMTRNLKLILSLCFAIGTTASAQNVAPVVKAPIAAFTEFAGAAARSIDLTAAFSDPDGSNAVQMAVLLPSSTGFFNIALDGQHKPITVANFLNYVNSGRYFVTDPTTHMLASSFVHRSISGFVVQGGGFIGTADPAHPNNALPSPVALFPAIQNEPGISNKLGTIAMAKVDGNPNSATSQWFINLANNGGPPSNLDTQNGGFTVFGHVTGAGMIAVNQIAAVPVSHFAAPYDSLPLRNFSTLPIKIANLVSVSSITVIPPLAFTATSDNPAVAKATISGKNLLVAGLQPGTAHITAKATDLDGANVSQTFTVTVITGPARLANISTRAQVGTGGNVLIGGFVISGSNPKRILARAIGPTLGQPPFNVPNALMDPVLQLYESNALLFSNDNWVTAANKQEITDTGRAPGSSQEPAILTTLA